MLSYSIDCCGIAEISNVYDDPPEQIVKEVQDNFFRNDPWRGTGRIQVAYAIFSNVGGSKGAAKLAAYIRKRKLGTVTKLPLRKNPNSGSFLKAYVWGVDYTALKKWKA